MSKSDLICSFFIPSQIYYINDTKNFSLIPINKGVIGYINKSENLDLINIKDIKIQYELYEIFKSLFKNTKYGLIIYSEVPLLWQFNIIHAIIVGFTLFSEFQENKEILIDKVITKCVAMAAEFEIFDLPFIAYMYKRGIIYNRENKTIDSLKKIDVDYFVIKYDEDKYKLKSLENIIFKKEKINSFQLININKYKVLTAKNENLKDAVELLIRQSDAEKILVARYYTEGIKFYIHNSKL
jgi:hypothetical protein